jgi:hypothetical protein
MDRRPSDRVLEEWDSVTRNVQRPEEAPRRRAVRGSFGLMTLVPLAALALVVAVGVIWLGGRETGVGGRSPAPTSSVLTADASPPASATPAPSAPASASPSAVPTPSLTPEPSLGCQVTARIVSWEGAAGSRIATVELKNDGPEPCTLPAVARPILIDGSGGPLALGAAPADPGTIELESGAIAHGLVQVSNICPVKPVVAPVTIVFDLGDGVSITAQPLSAGDATVPPCNGPTQPSEIQMQPWTR